MRLRAVGFSLLAAFACAAVAPGATPVLRVLFIGNSLTYTNDLPGMLSRVARAAGDSILTAQVAGPNLALIDHLAGATDALGVIDRGGWTHVVLQQGPTTIGVCRDTLVLAATRFAAHIRAGGARTALFMPWGALDGRSPLEASRGSWLAAARATDGLLLPVGDAFDLARRDDPRLPLYGPDGYHPAPAGTLLAALTIYERLTGHDVRTIPLAALEIPGAGVTSPVIRRLVQAAHAATLLPDDAPVAPPAAREGPC